MHSNDTSVSLWQCVIISVLRNQGYRGEKNTLKGVQRPAAIAIVCFCLCEYRTVRYSGSCEEQVFDFAQSMPVFVLPLKAVCHAFDWVIMTIRRIGNLNG